MVNWKAELDILRKNIQDLINFPDENYPRRTEDGYPSEFVYDDFAYKRIIDTYRNFLKELLKFEPELVPREKQPERILCASTYCDNGIEYQGQPQNIATGFVLSGHRHDNPMVNYMTFIEQNVPSFDNSLMVNGFLTSKNRFVTREEAYLIAVEAGQIVKRDSNSENEILISEELY